MEPCAPRTVPLVSKDDLRKIVGRVRSAIDSRFAGRDLTIVATAEGALPFACDLRVGLQNLRSLDALTVGVHNGSDSDGNIIREAHWTAGRSFRERAITDRAVLIVDDAVSTGATLRVVEASVWSHRPRSVTFATLIDRRDSSSGNSTLHIEYRGVEIDSEAIIVGYGLDHKGFGREKVGLHWVREGPLARPPEVRIVAPARSFHSR